MCKRALRSLGFLCELYKTLSIGDLGLQIEPGSPIQIWSLVTLVNLQPINGLL